MRYRYAYIQRKEGDGPSLCSPSWPVAITSAWWSHCRKQHSGKPMTLERIGGTLGEAEPKPMMSCDPQGLTLVGVLILGKVPSTPTPPRAVPCWQACGNSHWDLPSVYGALGNGIQNSEPPSCPSTTALLWVCPQSSRGAAGDCVEVSIQPTKAA